jgi:hypothetical protein
MRSARVGRLVEGSAPLLPVALAFAPELVLPPEAAPPPLPVGLELPPAEVAPALEPEAPAEPYRTRVSQM